MRIGISAGKRTLQFLSKSDDHLLQLLLLAGKCLPQILLLPEVINSFPLQFLPQRLNSLTKLHDFGMARRDYLLDSLLLVGASRFQFGPHGYDRPSELYNLVGRPYFPGHLAYLTSMAAKNKPAMPRIEILAARIEILADGGGENK
jgi:hypothetical protein